MKPLSFKRHRFPAEVIRHAVWLYFRFSLSFRDVEELMAQRGINVSYETIRCWTIKFGPLIARRLKKWRTPPTGRWHLDEMVCKIGGRRMYLWRAVDDEGEVLDVVVQRRRDTEAALKLIRRLLCNQPVEPESQRMGWRRTVRRLISWECDIFIVPVDCETITALRILTCQFGDVNGSRRGSNPKLQRKDFSPRTRRSTTPSISSVI